jgi:hypothetical protein
MNRKVVGILGGSKPFFSLPHLEITTNDPDEKNSFSVQTHHVCSD